MIAMHNGTVWMQSAVNPPSCKAGHRVQIHFHCGKHFLGPVVYAHWTLSTLPPRVRQVHDHIDGLFFTALCPEIRTQPN